MVNLRLALNKAIDLFRSTVTIKVVTAEYDKYGDASTSSASTTSYAAVNDITGDERWNEQGLFVPGDKIFFFKGETTGVNVGNIIVLDDTEYEITQEPIKHEINNIIQAIECRAKKI